MSESKPARKQYAILNFAYYHGPNVQRLDLCDAGLCCFQFFQECGQLGVDDCGHGKSFELWLYYETCKLHATAPTSEAVTYMAYFTSGCGSNVVYSGA